MKASSDNRSLHFAGSGGEMGTLLSAFDWAGTRLDTPDQWPQSLRITLGIVLHSAFPMFLCWGKDLLYFYNDAFKLNDYMSGRHPAIGKKGSEVWAETWDFIGPVIEQVMASGKPVYFEDQPVPVQRNGQLQETYWTFSCSPAYGDAGQVEGVLVVCHDTTASVLAIKKLGESRQRFSTMTDNTDILIAMSDKTSNATYFNKAWEVFTGRTEKELLNFGWADLIHEEDRQGFLDLYLQAFKHQQPWTGEFRMLNKEGRYRWLLAKGPVRYEADGSFGGYISSSIDITERKKVEKLLQASEHRVRSVIESAPFPIGIYAGRHMQIEFANQSILDVWGKGNDVIGKLYSEILPELDNQEIFSQLEHVYTTGEPFHARNQRVDIVVDGLLQPYYFNYSFTPLYDGAGKIYGVMNTAAEITDLNLAKQKIEQSEKNFRNMILQAPVAMCIMLGPRHVVEVANDSMIALWGKRPADVMHKPMFEGLPDAGAQGLEELLDHVYHNDETVTASERPVVLFRHGRFETVYQNFTYEPYKDADGTVLGVLAISMDVTAQVLARRKIEEVVAERTRELAKSNAELAQFAYIASHDLQEPLRKISTFAQMLEDNLGDIDERSKTYFTKINSSAARMTKLIRDVLSYSQLSKESEVFEKVDLQQVVKDIAVDFELLIEQKSAELSYHDLPVVKAIPLQMSQLFGNLISNALKYSRPGVAPVISITTEVLKDSDPEMAALRDNNVSYYRIKITDNGIGFKQEHNEQIFNIFQRLHGKSDYAGTGIGLAMCKKIVHNHHGEIYARGGMEHGASFIVLLPVMQ